MNFHGDLFRNGTVLKTKFIDTRFTLEFMSCVFYLWQVKPLIWIESVIERHSHSRVEYMIKVGGTS